MGTEEEAIDSLAGKAKVTLDGRDLVLRVLDEEDGAFRLVGNVYEGSRIIEGRGERPDGTWIEWAALRQGDGGQGQEKPDSEADADTADTGEKSGSDSDAVDAAAEDAGLWPPDRSRIRSLRTDEPHAGPGVVAFRRRDGLDLWAEGKIENGEVIVHQGRIKAVGQTFDPARLRQERPGIDPD